MSGRLRIPRPTPATVMAFIAMVFAMGGLAVAAIPGPTGTIKGCYKKNKGNLRLISHTKKCKKSERTITWNQKGATGAPGQQGAAGSTGATGAPGATTVIARRAVQTNIGNNTQSTDSVSCASGERLVGGGAGFVNALNQYDFPATLHGSVPTGADGKPVTDLAAASGWRASALNQTGSTRDFVVVALCASP